MTPEEGDSGDPEVTPDFNTPQLNEKGGWGMLAEFYHVTKKVNSTYTPPAGSGKEYQVVLKQDTGRSNPTLIIDGIDRSYNYFWWDNAYYFVDNIVYKTGTIYEITGVKDCLASFKEQIYNATAYVEYSGQKFNKYLPDQRLSMTGDTSVAASAVNIVSETAGSYIIGVAGKGSQANVGFTCMYSMPRSGAANLADILYDESFIAEVKKFFNDPYEAIISAHWVPFTPLTLPQIIFFGGKSSGLLSDGLSPEPSKTPTTVTIQIPWINGDWRDFSPYSQFKLELPFYGTIDLDTAVLQGHSSITVQYLMDAISGEVNYTVICGEWVGTFTVGTAVNLAVGQSSGNNITAIGSAVAGAAGAIAAVAAAPLTAGGTVAAYAALGTGVTAIAGGWMTSMTHDVSAKGGQGGFGRANTVLHGDEKNRAIRLVQYSFKMAEGNPSGINQVNGRPLFDTVKLSTIWGGYIQTAGASIPIDGLAEDRAQVNSLLNSGIFVE